MALISHSFLPTRPLVLSSVEVPSFPVEQSRQVTRARLQTASDSLVNFDAPIF